jgi:hypothetical protein
MERMEGSILEQIIMDLYKHNKRWLVLNKYLAPKKQQICFFKGKKGKRKGLIKCSVSSKMLQMGGDSSLFNNFLIF